MGKKKGKEHDVTVKDDFDPVSLITKKPETVVLVLQSQEEAVLQTVCEALYKFADKSIENKKQILNIGAVEHLIRLIQHEDKVVKRNAAMCLGTVSSEETSRRIIRKLGGIPPLIALLSQEEELICHEFGSLALSFLAEDYASKCEIFEKQGLPLLINLLSSSDCDVQHNAVRTVGLLLEDFQTRSVFKELNGVEPLLTLLESLYPVIQQMALSALITCVQDGDNRASLREFDGLSKLVEIIGNESLSDLHVMCLKCLAGCLADMESVKLIQATGIFEKLLGFITSSPHAETQECAASVIAAACKVDENRKMFHEQDTEQTLVSLLNSDNLSVVISAVKALAALAENLSSRDKIGKIDGVTLIFPLLKHDSAEAKEIATLALANLTNNNTYNASVVMEKNTTDVIIKLLSEQNPVIQSNCAVCLSNVAVNETWRADLENRGVIKGLAAAIQSTDANVQICVCQALSAFLCDNESRLQLLNENVFATLVKLLKSNSERVCKNASWVIVLCAVDRSLSEEITRCGGLDVLQELNLSSRRTKFTEIAMERLLNSNLSAKYALTGLLTFDNIMEDMFYDTGKIGEGRSFMTLEELKDAELNQNRPVILVNFQKIPKTTSFPITKIESMEIKTPSVKSIEKPKGKDKKKQEKTKRKSLEDDQKPEEPLTTFVVEPTPSFGVHILVDKEFLEYIDQVKNEISAIATTESQIRRLACFVCEKMGGMISKEELCKFSFELHMSELKIECNSNVIPIGKIEKGIYYHRALLFKALSDSIYLTCSLVRGEYGRAWNEVQICDMTENGFPVLPPKTYIVDLMHVPGDLLQVGSPRAVTYQQI